MAPHSSTPENPTYGGAWQAAAHEVAKSRTRLSDFTFTFHLHALEKERQPTPLFLPGESQGRGSLVGCCLWGRTELDTTEATQQKQQQQGNRINWKYLENFGSQQNQIFFLEQQKCNSRDSLWYHITSGSLSWLYLLHLFDIKVVQKYQTQIIGCKPNSWIDF